MKRKSTTEENSTTANGGDDVTESKKRRRMSNEDAAPAKDTKRSKKDKQERKERKEKKHKKQSREEQAAALDAVYDEEAVPFGGEDQDQAMDDGDSKPSKKKASKSKSKSDDAAPPAADDSAKPETSKKKNKKNKKSADDSKSENPEELAAAAADGEEKTAESKKLPDQESARPKKAARFIVFVGNLPYSATVADIEKHFSAVHPTAVRLLHEKSNPNKSRGVAFVEFAGYDHMKTCLKTLHHSTMTCQGRDYHGRPKEDERKINVELTAGGGGNTDYRKERIRAKNEKLTGERDRRAKQEEIEKIKKEKERLLKGGAQKPDANGIHPSRLARVPKQK